MKTNFENSKQPHPFKVPENYFDQLYVEILNKKSPHTLASRYSWNAKLGLSLATITACVAILVVVFLPNQSSSHDWLADVSNEEIIYFLNQYEGWSMEELAQLTPENEILDTDMLPIFTDEFELNENLIDELFIEYETEIILPEI